MLTSSFSLLFKPLIKAAALISLTCAATLSTAGLLTVNGDTTGGPTWNRTFSGAPPTGLTSVGTAVRYEVTLFHVNADGAYTLNNSSAYDNFLHLYHTAFSPTSQFVNVIAADDDSGPGANAQLTTIDLMEGVDYFAVSSGFSTSDFGAFELKIEGSGDSTAILGSVNGRSDVPEPGSLALLGLGLMGLAAVRRRKA